MWQLKADGTFGRVAGVWTDYLLIDPNQKDPFDGVDPLALATAKAIKISFANHSDGRGFSLAKRLAEQFKSASQAPVLVATGKLIPDQARLAFQSGFDVIEIEDQEILRHGEDFWRHALSNSLPVIYIETNAVAGDIWNARAQNG